MSDEPKPFVPFNCPYCGVNVQPSDKHAQTIEKKGIRNPTIIVTCAIVRTFAVALTPAEP